MTSATTQLYNNVLRFRPAFSCSKVSSSAHLCNETDYQTVLNI